MRGKVIVSMLSLQSLQDHPRLCGEKSSGIVTSVPPSGSPPPMRGKGLVDCAAVIIKGITPAYAGKSQKIYDNGAITADHPRLCGEKPLYHKCKQLWGGSPPPMRGKGWFRPMWKRDAGITPAYAGKSAAESTP